MIDQQHTAEARHQQEKRKYQRHPWAIPVELKTSAEEALQGNLLNIARGGGLLETGGALPPSDLITLRFREEGDPDPEQTVLIAKLVWDMTAEGGPIHRYGLAFVRSQEEQYRKVRRRAEIAHARGLAEALGLKYVELVPSMVRRKALVCLDRDISFSLSCVPVRLRGNQLTVAMAAPNEEGTLKKLQVFCGCEIVPVVATLSAIRNTLDHFWGISYVPLPSGAQAVKSARSRSEERYRSIALVSMAPGVGQTQIGVNIASVLTALGRAATYVDLSSPGTFLSSENSLNLKKSDASLSSPDVSSEGTPTGDRSWQDRLSTCQWRILDLPSGTGPLSIDWAIRADEAILVVSPQGWQEGCQFIESLFHRFAETQLQSLSGKEVGRRVLDISVVCSRISDIPQGFRVFGQVEGTTHRNLNTQEPGFYARLHYLGGVLNDPDSILKAEKTRSPLTTLEPSSPAAQCMRHIAHSILTPVRERDPRVNFREAPDIRPPEKRAVFEGAAAKRSRSWVWLVGLGLVSLFFLFQSGRDFFSSAIEASRTWLHGGIESFRKGTPGEIEGSGAPQVSQDEAERRQGKGVQTEEGGEKSAPSSQVESRGEGEADKPLHRQPESLPGAKQMPVAKGPTPPSEVPQHKPEDLQASGSEGLSSKKSPQAPAKALPQPSKDEKQPPAIGEHPSEGIGGLTVQQSVITLGVENREPKDRIERVSVGHQRVYCWIYVTNGQGQRITVRWVSKGQTLFKIDLPVRSNDWRTWAHLALRPGMIGPAQAEILNGDGQLLETVPFEITE